MDLPKVQAVVSCVVWVLSSVRPCVFSVTELYLPAGLELLVLPPCLFIILAKCATMTNSLLFNPKLCVRPLKIGLWIMTTLNHLLSLLFANGLFCNSPIEDDQ